MLATYTPPRPLSSSAHSNLTMDMFAMAQAQPQYAFTHVPPVPARQYSGHGTSSAFSSSANPDEDWTKISDLAERRRIQNRIAQRNYRKKLKRRLEDLERRAGSSDEGESENPSPQAAKNTKRASPSKAQKPRQAAPPAKPVSQMQFTPPLENNDELLLPPTYDDRERSHTPPVYPYSSYPPPDETLLAPYGAAQPYQTMVTMDAYPGYLSAASMASTVPSVTHFSDALKRDSYSSDNGLTQYPAYGFYPGVEVNAPSPFDQSNPHTPPLSHTFDHSANCSESGYEYPATPLSMPGSPGLVQPQLM